RAERERASWHVVDSETLGDAASGGRGAVMDGAYALDALRGRDSIMNDLGKKLFDGIDDTVRRTLSAEQIGSVRETCDWLGDYTPRKLAGQATAEEDAIAKVMLSQLETIAGLAVRKAVKDTLLQILSNLR